METGLVDYHGVHYSLSENPERVVGNEEIHSDPGLLDLHMLRGQNEELGMQDRF